MKDLLSTGADIVEYQKLVGKLMYLQRGSRLDITVVICRLAQFCTDPTVGHWNALIRVLRFSVFETLWIPWHASLHRSTTVFVCRMYD